MKWQEFKESIEDATPPASVDTSEWEVVIVVKGERQFEFGLLGVDFEEGDDMGLESAVILQVRRQ